MCFVVSFTFCYIFYAREDEQLFTIDNHIDMFVFLARINQALNEFKDLDNSNQLRTESKLSVVKWSAQPK